MALDDDFYAPAIADLAGAKAMALEQLDRITTAHEDDGTIPASKYYSPIMEKRRAELTTAINAAASIDAVLAIDLSATWPSRTYAGGLSVGHPYIVAFDVSGVPEASEILIHHVFAYAGAFPVSLTGSYVKADTAATGSTAIDVIRACRADVVLMDIRMPGRDGIATTRAITVDDDLAGVRVIVLTTFELDEYVVGAMRAGASGFLDKGVAPDTLLDAIRVVAGGDALLTPNATRALLASITDDPAPTVVDEEAIQHLTAREREVVALVGRGLSNDEIADTLYLSPLTVKTHVSRAMTKLHARDRAQLVVIALRTGLTRLDEL